MMEFKFLNYFKLLRGFVLNVGKIDTVAFNLTSDCNSHCQCSPSYIERNLISIIFLIRAEKSPSGNLAEKRDGKLAEKRDGKLKYFYHFT